jgi:hypothetical protein
MSTEPNQTLYSVFFDSNGSRYEWNSNLSEYMKFGMSDRHWIDKEFLYFFFKAALLNNNNTQEDENDDDEYSKSLSLNSRVTQDEHSMVTYNHEAMKLAIEKIRDIKPDEITIAQTRLTAYLCQLSFQRFFQQTISKHGHSQRVDLYRKQKQVWSVYEQNHDYDPSKHMPVTYGLYLTPDTSLIKVYLFHPYLESKMELAGGSSAFLGMKKSPSSTSSKYTPRDYIFIGSLSHQAMLAQDFSILSTKLIANFIDQAVDDLD